MGFQQMVMRSIEEGIHQNDQRLELATFGMGCFWGPEARFGSMPGVVRTCVGFTGGTTPTPTYRQMGDHTETVHISFDPRVISYEAILREFWQNHYPNRDNYKGRQYISLVHYHTEQQRKTIENIRKEMETQLREPIETEIAPFGEFTLAEERHQKYYLKRYPKALEQLAELFPEKELLTDSTFAARLNGFVKGYGTKDSVREDIAQWRIGTVEKKWLTDLFLKLKW
ncbi:MULTISPECIES: peptide-methionine (S)-S-oxide reductase MsrA [Planococcus]|uniref:Peptide methionine sulfoxide reductase MsrA n=1 Tax=Planococcus kocurii TaxID=1374 RepID=A0ABN4JVY9_9BACL|nr:MULTISPECIES: peptide-methionine (S)-S-oxide reductase MsrA [Planococcus]ALS77572.1 peptide methionine sulfoxide reductase [Planococcus kocurii]KAA0959045.1 peptide-methionine (S)-S-oxide reductase MsrA [Planococcus sp. ANT_H30]MDJ0330163.1 peptide-methionine (S)-S-oxide reductase MsrA [Planococcus sp. S3-L1]